MFKDTRQSLQDKVWSRSRCSEGDSLICKWWLEASCCKQVLYATREEGAVAILFLQTYMYLVQGDRWCSVLHVSPLPRVQGQLCGSTAVHDFQFCTGLWLELLWGSEVNCFLPKVLWKGQRGLGLKENHEHVNVILMMVWKVMWVWGFRDCFWQKNSFLLKDAWDNMWWKKNLVSPGWDKRKTWL